MKTSASRRSPTIVYAKTTSTADGNTENAPFVKSGLQGAHVGMALRYRFTPNIGLLFAPEIDVQFPTFLLNIDPTIGLEASF